MKRGHATTGYIDVALMGIGAYLILVNGDWILGGIIAAIGLAIHVITGD